MIRIGLVWSLLSIAFFAAQTRLHAQFETGTKMAGSSIASLGYSVGTTDQSVSQIGSNSASTRNYSLAITPAFGWFISDKTVIGFLVNINPSGERVTYEENGSSYQQDKLHGLTFGGGGFARNYFSDGKNLLPFAQFSFDLGVSSRNTEGYFYGGSLPAVYKRTYEGKSGGGFYANLGVSAGVTKMLGSQVGLDLFAGYRYSYNKNTVNLTTWRDDLIDGTVDETGKSETTTKSAHHHFQLGAGFQVFLSRRKK